MIGTMVGGTTGAPDRARPRIPGPGSGSRPIVVGLLVAITALAGGCGDDDGVRTALLVGVDTDYRVTDELEMLRVRTLEVDGGALVSSVELTLAPTDDLEPGVGEFPVPLSFVIEPLGGDARRRVRLEIDALRTAGDRVPLFTRSAVTGFIRGRTLQLPMFLARQCANVVCEEGFTCTENGCEPELRDPEDLEDAPETAGDEILNLCARGCPGAPTDGRALVAGGGAEARAVDASPDGQTVFIAGTARGTVDFGGGDEPPPDGSGPDLFVAAYAAGDLRTLRWARRSTGDGPERATALAAHPDGGVIVAGAHKDMTFAGRSLAAADDREDAAVVRLASDGTLRWVAELRGEGDEEVKGLAVDASGNVYAAVRFRDELDLSVAGEAERIEASRRDDAALVALDGETGDGRWFHHIGAQRDETPVGVAVDGSGTVYMVAMVAGPVDLGTGMTVPRGGADGALVAVDAATGDVRWAERFGAGMSDDVAAAVARPDRDGVFLAGTFEGRLDYRNDVTLESAGSRDAFVLEVGPDGAAVAGYRLGGLTSEFGHAVALDALGRVYLAGNYEGNASDIGLGETAASGSSDGYVTAFRRDGAVRWAQPLVSERDTDAFDVAVDADGRVHVVGEFQGVLDAGQRVGMLFHGDGEDEDEDDDDDDDTRAGYLITFVQDGFGDR